MALFFEIDKKNCQVELACLKMMKVNDRYIYFLTFFVKEQFPYLSRLIELNI